VLYAGVATGYAGWATAYPIDFGPIALQPNIESKKKTPSSVTEETPQDDASFRDLPWCRLEFRVTRRRPDVVPHRASVSNARVPVCLMPAVWPPAVRPLVSRQDGRLAKNRMQQLRSDGWNQFLERVTLFCNKHGVQIPTMEENYVPYGKSARYARNETNDDHFRKKYILVLLTKLAKSLIIDLMR
jgi:hypothetical protein